VSAPIKVRVTVTVTVDPERWELMYGGQDDLRDDVKSYVREAVQQSNAGDAKAITSTVVR
jgi:hypothetical protein